MTVDELKAFEAEVARAFECGKIRGPVHLSGGNEARLIRIFQDVADSDWVFSTYRSHYHALLKGIPAHEVMKGVMASRSMNLYFPGYRFFTSAIVAGAIPAALGVAAGIKRRGGNEKVWVFVGDMAATTGICHEARRYATGHRLPISFITEDNGLSADTPTQLCWGDGPESMEVVYQYQREWPHVGSGKWVKF